MNVIRHLVRRVKIAAYKRRKAEIREWERRASALLERELDDLRRVVARLEHTNESQRRELDLRQLEIDRLSAIYQRDSERVKTEMALQIRLREAEQPNVTLGR